MFVKVIVSNKEGVNAICVPSSAIVSQDGRNYVVVYKGDDDMKIAEVEIMKTVGERTYVKSGLQAGQLLITKNQLFIFNKLLNE